MSNLLNDAHAAFAVAEIAENFKLFYKELTKLSHALVYRVFKQDRPDLTEDITGHILLKLPEFKGDAAFSTWAYVLARNFAIGELRKERFRREQEITPELENSLSVEDATCQSVMTRLPDNLISKLPKADREFLALIIQYNGSMTEISNVTGTSRWTIQRKRNRLLRKLKILLQQ